MLFTSIIQFVQLLQIDFVQTDHYISTSTTSTTASSTSTSTSTSAECKTEVGNTCLFPFIYDEITYTNCTTRGHDRPWCATSTDESGIYEEWAHEWGDCGPSCLGIVGREGSRLKESEANSERIEKDANDNLDDGRSSPKDGDKTAEYEGDDILEEGRSSTKDRDKISDDEGDDEGEDTLEDGRSSPKDGDKLSEDEGDDARHDSLEDGKSSPKDGDKLSKDEGDELVCVDRWSDYASHIDDDKAGVDYSEMPERGRGVLKETHGHAIVSINNKLYLKFGKRKSDKKPKTRSGITEAGNDYDYQGQNRIMGGQESKPHEFPWIVRIIGGCAYGLCGGSLISRRLILSSYHCTYDPVNDSGYKPCDHSDGKRLAVLGRHQFRIEHLASYYIIPIIDVKYPPHQGLWTDHRTHDFAILVLKEPAMFSPNIKPICLPKQDEEFGSKFAIAAGWGRTAQPDIDTNQSPVLKSVKLMVSQKKYKHSKMFGTKLCKKQGEFQDPCSGDSGGPLMLFNDEIAAFTIIGTVQGAGYSCNSDRVFEFEGSSNGLWNKVSVWVDWIKGEMEKMGETGCKELEQHAKLRNTVSKESSESEEGSSSVDSSGNEELNKSVEGPQSDEDSGGVEHSKTIKDLETEDNSISEKGSESVEGSKNVEDSDTKENPESEEGFEIVDGSKNVEYFGIEEDSESEESSEIMEGSDSEEGWLDVPPQFFNSH